MSQNLTGIAVFFFLMSLIRVQNAAPRPTGDSALPVNAPSKTVIKVFLFDRPIAHARITLLAKSAKPEISGETDEDGNFVCYPSSNDFNLSVESGPSRVNVPIKLGTVEEEVQVNLRGPQTPSSLGVPANVPQNLILFRAVYKEQPFGGAIISVESGIGITWLCKTNGAGLCSLELPRMDLFLSSTLMLYPFLADSRGQMIKIHRPLMLSETRGEVLLEFDRAEREQHEMPERRTFQPR